VLNSEPGDLLRIGGNLYTSYSVGERLAVGGVAVWQPLSAFFLRVGTSFAPRSEVGPLRYQWGLGYDDWRERTLSVQLNNYGPITPERGLDLEGAEVQVAYKLPRLCLGTLCAAASSYLTAPLRIGPALGTQLTLTFRERWFLMGGGSVYLPGLTVAERIDQRWRWSYGVGWRHWRPGTPFVTYFNWGPEYSPRAGVLAVGINWAL
jgi:hypothetical protein